LANVKAVEVILREGWSSTRLAAVILKKFDLWDLLGYTLDIMPLVSACCEAHKADLTARPPLDDIIS